MKIKIGLMLSLISFLKLNAQLNIAVSYSNRSAVYNSKRDGDAGKRYLNLMHGIALEFGETQLNDNRSYFTFSYHSTLQKSDKMVNLYNINGFTKYNSMVYVEPINNGPFLLPGPISKEFNYSNTYTIVNLGFKRLWRIHKKSTQKLKHYIGVNLGFTEITNGLLVDNEEAVKSKYALKFTNAVFLGACYMNEVKLNKKFALTTSLDASISKPYIPSLSLALGARYYFNLK